MAWWYTSIIPAFHRQEVSLRPLSQTQVNLDWCVNALWHHSPMRKYICNPYLVSSHRMWATNVILKFLPRAREMTEQLNVYTAYRGSKFSPQHPHQDTNLASSTGICIHLHRTTNTRNWKIVKTVRQQWHTSLITEEAEASQPGQQSE